jgi:hypothetical protein
MNAIYSPAVTPAPPFFRSKAPLQIAIAVGGLVPVGAGLAGVLLGPVIAGRQGGNAALDSHFAYLSGLLLAIGLAFWSAIPTIERRGGMVRLLTFLVAVGGLARLISYWRVGPPGGAMQGALVMELVVTPALCLWQWRLQRRMDAAARAV